MLLKPERTNKRTNERRICRFSQRASPEADPTLVNSAPRESGRGTKKIDGRRGRRRMVGKRVGCRWEAKFESALLIRTATLIGRSKIKIRAGARQVPQKSSRGETSLTPLININGHDYYTHDAYCLHRIGATRAN